MSGKDWGKHDRLAEHQVKEKKRKKNRKYYEKNKDRIKEKNKKTYLKRRYELYHELGKKCVFCGIDDIEVINFHHRVPMMVYENKIYHYIRNRDIIMPLCIKCHTTYHLVMDWLKIDDIFKE